MRKIRLLAIAAIAVPTIAAAQVGPNPAVPGGSQSPTVGGSSDVLTAPQDAPVAGRASGNVLDRTIDTQNDGTVGPDAGTATSRTGSEVDSGATDTGTSIGTETQTKTRTKGMEPQRKRR